jgi:hypothetical protein
MVTPADITKTYRAIQKNTKHGKNREARPQGLNPSCSGNNSQQQAT